MEIYLIFVDAIRNSNKFWSSKVEGNQLTVEWGRVGYNSQTKVHSFPNNQQAILKYRNLVAEKIMKGYRISQSRIDSSCEIHEIRRAIELLDFLRRYVEERKFNDSYIDLVNQYLKIIPTPLGMKIDPYTIYQNVEDIEHQRELLSSLLENNFVVLQPTTTAVKTETTTVSLKAINKSFWRHL